MRKTSTLLAALIVSGCTTTQSSFYKDPDKQTVTNLCRAWAKTQDPKFARDLQNELRSRGVTSPQECQKRINVENAIITGIAVAGAAVAIGAAAQNGYGGSGYSGYDSYGVAWDQFYNQYYQLIWRCRSRSNGQFVDDYYCAGKPKTDFTWPGWSA